MMDSSISNIKFKWDIENIPNDNILSKITYYKKWKKKKQLNLALKEVNNWLYESSYNLPDINYALLKRRDKINKELHNL